MTKDTDKNFNMTVTWLDAIGAAHSALVLPEVYTFQHQVLTTPLVHTLARSLGLNSQESRVLQLAARLHDFGKIGLLPIIHDTRNKVLDRNSKEFTQIKQHTILGEIFFRSLIAYVCNENVLSQLAMVCRWHHERIDGTGYPDQLRGNQIPKMVKIISVLDVLSAVTGGDRPWQRSMTILEARKELLRVRGTQLDAEIVNTLENVFIQANGKNLIDREDAS